MHTLHGSDVEEWMDPTDWIKSTTTQFTPSQWTAKQKKSRSRGDDRNEKSESQNAARGSGYDRNDQSANSCHMEYFFPLHQGELEVIPRDNIEILDVLGYGWNGACFKVKWNGTEYAMKQFDIGRHGDTYFRQEIRAYMLLRRAWGILVPRPIFTSESFSGGRMFLGLQLGRTSTGGDDREKIDKVLEQIEKEYGIRRNDCGRGRNMITITDTNGMERVVAIDFDDWDDVSVNS